MLKKNYSCENSSQDNLKLEEVYVENNKVKWPKGMCSVEVPYKGMLYKMELFISIL